MDSALKAPVAGPLVFYAYSGQTSHAIVGDFEPGIPTKVGVGVVHPITTAVTMEGWECATGQPLRFWYKECCPFASLPVAESQLAVTGDLQAVLAPGASQGYPGYMLFTRPGLWKVTVKQGDQILGAVILQVVEF